jgi:hypothetical protein
MQKYRHKLKVGVSGQKCKTVYIDSFRPLTYGEALKEAGKRFISIAYLDIVNIKTV